MKIFILLFVFALMGSVMETISANECQHGGYRLNEVCDPKLKPGTGRRGYGKASGSECKNICTGPLGERDGYCGRGLHCCCIPF